MNLDFNLNLEQKQELVMTPELRMAIELLQYNSFELRQYIKKEMKENPLLDMMEAERGRESSHQNFNYEKKDSIEYEKFIAYKPDICEHLENQLFEVLEKKDINLGKFIVGSLNQNGKLTLDYETITDIFSSVDSSIDADYIEKIHQKIKKLNVNHKYDRELSKSEFIDPDFMIRKNNGVYEIIENHKNYPRLKINSYYFNLLKKHNDQETQEYIKKKYQSALWLIKSIKQRRDTIQKIIEAILDKQKEFFERGFKYLTTMTMEEVAKKIEMHESTVSRATTSKYVETPHGTFNLKFFFNSGIDNLSSVSIKAIISEEITKENKNNPLSDKKLREQIKSKYNLNISRRTVAKYRKSIGIESSRTRKKLNKN